MTKSRPKKKKVEETPFSKEVSLLRLESGMTQPELASLMNVSVRSVSGWENGDRTPRNAERLLVSIKQSILSEQSGQSINTADANPLLEPDQQGEGKDMIMFQKHIEALEKIVQRDETIFKMNEKITELKAQLKKATPSMQKENPDL